MSTLRIISKVEIKSKILYIITYLVVLLAFYVHCSFMHKKSNQNLLMQIYYWNFCFFYISSLAYYTFISSAKYVVFYGLKSLARPFLRNVSICKHAITKLQYQQKQKPYQLKAVKQWRLVPHTQSNWRRSLRTRTPKKKRPTCGQTQT